MLKSAKKEFKLYQLVILFILLICVLIYSINSHVHFSQNNSLEQLLINSNNVYHKESQNHLKWYSNQVTQEGVEFYKNKPLVQGKLVTKDVFYENGYKRFLITIKKGNNYSKLVTSDVSINYTALLVESELKFHYDELNLIYYIECNDIEFLAQDVGLYNNTTLSLEYTYK